MSVLPHLPTRGRGRAVLAGVLVALLAGGTPGFAATSGSAAEAVDIGVLTGAGVDDAFGYSLAVDEDTLVVGSPRIQARGGAAFVFVRSATGWVQQAVLHAPDGALNDTFGFSVAVSGDTVAVGSVYDAPGGSVYLFRRSATTWALEAKLVGPAGRDLDQFGVAVDLDGDLLVVGADGQDTAAGPDAGSAFTFLRRGTGWRLQDTLVPSDASSSDDFGAAVLLSGSTVLVGAPNAGPFVGAVYVFDRTGGSWTQVARVTPPDVPTGFGRSLALDHGTLLVGAPLDMLGQGSAYVFDRAGAGYAFHAKLVAPDGQMFDEFGSSVVLAGPVATVGAAFDDVAGEAIVGSAYVFRRTDGGWGPRAHLTRDVTTPGYFGLAMATDGTTLFVGAQGNLGQAGATYLYSLAPA